MKQRASLLVFSRVRAPETISIFTNHMIRNSRNYISDHLATKQNKSHEMLANVTPHVTQSQNVPYNSILNAVTRRLYKGKL